MFGKSIIAAVLASSLGAIAGCTDNQGINAATGGLAGAAVGSQFGGGQGRVAATLGGAAIGTAVGGRAPATQTCIYRDAATVGTYRAPCPN